MNFRTTARVQAWGSGVGRLLVFGGSWLRTTITEAQSLLVARDLRVGPVHRLVVVQRRPAKHARLYLD